MQKIYRFDRENKEKMRKNNITLGHTGYGCQVASEGYPKSYRCVRREIELKMYFEKIPKI